jgi:hypothetical protein
VGFFSRRRKRESATRESPNEAALGSFASSEGQPVVGRQVAGGQPAIEMQNLGGLDGLQALMQLGPMIQQAITTGNVQISQGEPQVLDMRGSDLGEEIKGIMSAHGIDTDAASANANVDASTYGEMQQQILAALARHGIDPGAAGSAVNFQVQPGEGE